MSVCLSGSPADVGSPSSSPGRRLHLQRQILSLIHPVPPVVPFLPRTYPLPSLLPRPQGSLSLARLHSPGRRPHVRRLVLPSPRHAPDPDPDWLACDPSVIEGLYLFLDCSPWSEACALLDERIFLATQPEVCRRRLIARHLESGVEATLERAENRGATAFALSRLV